MIREIRAKLYLFVSTEKIRVLSLQYHKIENYFTRPTFILLAVLRKRLVTSQYLCDM